MNTRELLGQLYLLQVNDSLFPIGGYSHSYGLETYIQEDAVHDLATAEEYIRKKLAYSFLYTDLLAVRLAFDAAECADYPALSRLEEILEASRLPLELREASKKLGSRFVKTVSGLTIPWKDDSFQLYREQQKGTSICHPCAYGVFCEALGLSRRDALAHFLYAQTSAMVTNCVKTIPLSQTSGQKLLSSLFPFFEELLDQAERASADMLCASAPGFDLSSIRHETLYSRLYMS